MTCQHFGLHLDYLIMLFGTIQSIYIYLCTPHGISKSFYTSTPSKLFQDSIQGNNVASIAWFISSIFLVRFLYLHNMVPSHSTPTSLISYTLAGLLYVDDADLFIRNNSIESLVVIVSYAQKTLDL